MADKKTVDKVKELLGGHVYGPLKEAAEKWLAEADEKYGDKFDDLKEKGSEAWDKLGEFADKYSEKSIEVGEKFSKVSEKVAEGVDKFTEKAVPVVDSLKEKAAPKIDEFKEKAAPKIDELKGKAAPVVDKVTEMEFIKQLKAGISSLDEVIDTFSKPEMKEAMGEEAAAQIKAHAEAMKAEGKTFCDCPACTKAREILKDLGVELEVPEAEEPAAEEAAAEEPEVTE
jgi:glutaredoxin